jgi:hypothetical protein
MLGLGVLNDTERGALRGVREVKVFKAIKDRAYTLSAFSPKNQKCFDLYMGGTEKIFKKRSDAIKWLGHKPGIFYSDGNTVKQEFILEEIEIA